MILASLTLLAVTLSPALPADVYGQAVVAATKKKPKSKSKSTDTPAETSEGLDLSEPVPAATPEPVAPTPAEPPPPEEPPPPPPAHFSIVTPNTVGKGGNLLEAGVGWPGVHFGYWRGILDKLDVGARVDFDWGYEGILTSPQFGFDLRAQGKYRFFEKDKLTVGATFKPGLLFYFPPNRGAHVGLSLPLGANLGYALSDKLNLGVTFELPIFTLFGTGTVFPLLLGAGAEYFFNEKLAVFVALRAGPGFWTNGGGVVGVLDAKVGVGFHL